MTAGPALAAAFETRWAALPALETLGVKVRRGLPVGGLPVADYLIVEFDGNPDGTTDRPIRFETTPGDMAGTTVEERGEITCTAVAQSGGKDLDASEAKAHAMIGAVIADLALNRTAGGVVGNATVTSGSAARMTVEQGVAVVVPFVVTYFATYAASAA